MKLSSARKVLASCLIVPPFLWAISSLVGPNTDHGSSTANQLKDLNSVAAHKGAYVTSGVLFLVGAILFMVATYAIVHVYRGRKVGLGQIAGGLLAIGTAVFFSFYAFGTVQYGMVSHSEFRTPATQHLFARFNHLGNNASVGTPIFIAFVLGIVLGSILLGIAMIRRRNVPLWAGILMIVSGPLSFVANGNVANIISFVVLVAALAPLALLVWRMSDEEWDAPREVAGARRGRPLGAEPVTPVEPSPAPAV